jgi:putative FmdB family regulatory protein
MPTYLFSCPQCGQFEEVMSITAKLEACPTCQGPIKKLINFNGGLKIEPNKQDAKEALDKEIRDFKKAVKKDPYLAANIIGEDSYQKRAQSYESQVKNLGNVAPKHWKRNY